MNIKPPFRFDGHGINDSEATRVTKVSCCEPYIDNKRNPEFDFLSELFAASYAMYESFDPDLLDEAAEHIEDGQTTVDANLVVSLLRGVARQQRKAIAKIEEADCR